MAATEHAIPVVRDVMHEAPTTVPPDVTLGELARLLAQTEASDAVVVDGDRVVGVVSEGDLLRAVLPQYDSLVERGGSVKAAFAAFVENGAHLADQPLHRIVIHDPVTLAPDDELLKAATVMVTKMIRRLPVVEDGRLVGTLSRADLCHGVMETSAPPNG